MSTDEQRFEQLEQQLQALQQRVAALEGNQPTPRQTASVLDLNLLERMRQREGPPYESAGMRGAITYAGAATIDQQESLWQIERPVPALMELDAVIVARVLAALGSPARITLVRTLMHGPQNSQQLQAALGGVSTGQLYHHLKELRSAGIIEQHGRSDYRIAASKIIPFLVTLACAFELQHTTEITPLT